MTVRETMIDFLSKSGWVWTPPSQSEIDFFVDSYKSYSDMEVFEDYKEELVRVTIEQYQK